jgi:prolyl 4-hydroxylase
MGVMTPPLLSLVMVIDTDTIRTSRYVVERLKLLPSSWGVSVQLKAQLHGRGGCFLENLADFLHEDPVPGLHVVCVRGNDDDGISVTMYPGSQTNNSLVRKILNNWSSFRSLLTDELNLHFYNAFTKDTTEKWTIYTPNGDKLVSIQDLTNDDTNDGADHNHHIMQTIVQQGMVLIYQGGAFVWPGVRIGFERHVKLQVPLTINNSISTADDTRQHYHYVTLKTLSLNPLVLSVQNFLTNSECHHIQTQAIPRMQYSDVSLMDQDKGKAASQFRTSQSTFLPSRADLKLQYIDHRVASLTRLPQDHQEMVQVLRYGLGGRFCNWNLKKSVCLLFSSELQNYNFD